MQSTFLEYVQSNASRFLKRVGGLGAWLVGGSVVCVILAIYAGLNGQDLTVPLGALFNCTLMHLGIYCSRNIFAAIKYLLAQSSQQVIAVPSVQRCVIPFATISPTSLPLDGLVRSYRLPPPLAPTISA